MAEILTEAQLLATFNGPQPEQIAMANLIRTLFSQREGTVAAAEPVAGTLGEELSAELVIGSAVSLTTATPKTITSLLLTPGDWDLTGIVTFVPAATTSITRLTQSISTTTNTHGNNKQKRSQSQAAVVPNAEVISDTPTVRVNISANTTYYLVAEAVFTVSTMTAYGYLRARRIR